MKEERYAEGNRSISRATVATLLKNLLINVGFGLVILIYNEKRQRFSVVLVWAKAFMKKGYCLFPITSSYGNQNTCAITLFSLDFFENKKKLTK